MLYPFDVNTAYLNSAIDEVIYLEAPDELKESGDMVWKLSKAIYGLKQSGRLWKSTLSNFSWEMAFRSWGMIFAYFA